MMWVLKFLPLVAMLHWAVGQTDVSVPGCAVRCWENTKYVSKCLGDDVCLCNEPDYQNSVYQCLYSQCDTAHFGSALHHSISRCFGIGTEILFAVPPVPNRDYLRRREAEYVAGALKIYGPGSAAGYPTESANLPTQSASYSVQSDSYATQSAGGPYSPTPTFLSPIPYFPLNTSPAITSATATEAAYSTTLETTTAASPQLYTGGGTRYSRSRFFLFLFTVGVTYWNV